MKSILGRALVGAAFSAMVATGALASTTGPGQVCYFGECGSVAQASRPRSLGTHGSWSAVAVNGDVLVLDRFNDGSSFAVIDPRNGDLGLAVSEPTWHLQQGQRMTLTIAVDGREFSGEAVAANDTTVVAHVAKSLIAALVKGQQAVLTVSGYQFTMHLADAAPAIADAAAYERQTPAE